MLKKVFALLALAMLLATPALADDRFSYEFELGAMGSYDWGSGGFGPYIYALGDNSMLNGDFWTKGAFGFQINNNMSLRSIQEIRLSFGDWYNDPSFGFFLKALYFEYAPSWGKVYVGRIDNDTNLYGLAGLGYDPEHNPNETIMRPYSPDYPADGVRLQYNWGNFRLTAQAEVVTKYTSSLESLWEMAGLYFGGLDFLVVDPLVVGSGAYHKTYRGEDFGEIGYYTQRYHLEGAYFWDGGAASLGLSFARANIWDKEGEDKYILNNFDVVPALVQNFGDFSLHAEGRFGIQKLSDTDGLAKSVSDPMYGLGLYLDGSYNYGPGSVTLAGWINSGMKYQRTGGVGNSEDILFNKWRYTGMSAFAPLLVAYGSRYSTLSMPFPLGDISASPLFFAQYGFEFSEVGTFIGEDPDSMAALQGSSTANHFGLGLFGTHAFSEKISVNAAMAWLGLVHPNYRVPQNALWEYETPGDVGSIEYDDFSNYADQSRNVGFEIDLGLSFALTKGLALDLSGGYFFSGRALDDLRYIDTPDSLGADTGVTTSEWIHRPNNAVFYAKLTYTF